MITFTLNTGLVTASGCPLPLDDWLTRYAKPERRLYVGTDSQQAPGFAAEIKPSAFTASSLADAMVRG
jgi:predicted RNase H-related nuclease YkuK (DUF458 family)